MKIEKVAKGCIFDHSVLLACMSFYFNVFIPFSVIPVLRRSSGDKIPRVEYKPEEHATWGVVYRQIQRLLPTHACSQHAQSLAKMERECNYVPETIPQLDDVSSYLRS